MIIPINRGYFTGCPMDGCENTLSGYVDLAVERFNERIEWQRLDLLINPSRGCISNGQSSLICTVDVGHVSINVTNGQLLWTIALNVEGQFISESLPVVNYQGYLIIANGTRCTLIDPRGEVAGIFDYIPKLIPPLAGPFVTNDGQIIVADQISFVGIEDSGVPLGVQALPAGYNRLSRSMSLNANTDRWYLIAQHNTTLSQVIIAAETTGSIVERLRIAWLYEFGKQSSFCNRTEGPLLSIDRKWLFVSNTTGILVISDDDESAHTEYLVNLSNFCANDMAFSDADSTLFTVDSFTYNILLVNVSTQHISSISLKELVQEEIIGQLSRMTLIQNHRLIIVVVTASRKALLLLIDVNIHRLISRVDLGYVSETRSLSPLTQLAYTQLNEEQVFVTIAHQAVGVMAVQLFTSRRYKQILK